MGLCSLQTEHLCWLPSLFHMPLRQTLTNFSNGSKNICWGMTQNLFLKKIFF